MSSTFCLQRLISGFHVLYTMSTFQDAANAPSSQAPLKQLGMVWRLNLMPPTLLETSCKTIKNGHIHGNARCLKITMRMMKVLAFLKILFPHASCCEVGGVVVFHDYSNPPSTVTVFPDILGTA